MRFITTRGLCAAAIATTALFAPARDARACGGLFQYETTQVASHRMILSVSQTQTTLYDQIQYSGSPTSFAWVLPIHGTVTVGLSSDALFDTLDQLTAVRVQSPDLSCPSCFASESSATSTGGGPGPGGVNVIAQSVVGPFQTVQLSSTDPNALTNWLTMNGYAIPSDVQPIIAAYVSEGFDFLAMKLVPGASVQAMKPVRVTTAGASIALPLRMVAAGAGTTLPITLFVLGEGRYAPTNFPTFTIDSSKLVWDAATNTSNYDTLRDQGFAAAGGNAWLAQSALAYSEFEISDVIDNLAMTDPTHSGYADAMGNGAPQAAMDDLSTLFAGITPTSLWITRLLAQMPRTALTADLTLGASPDQSPLLTTLSAPTVIHGPTCQPCNVGTGGTGGATGGTGGSLGATTTASTSGSAAGGASGGGGAGSAGHSASSCAVGPDDGAPSVVWAAIAGLCVLGLRRRRKAQPAR